MLENQQLFVMCSLINGLRYLGRMPITRFNGWILENVKRVQLLDPMRYIEAPDPTGVRVQLMVLPLYAAMPLIGMTCVEPISIDNLSELDEVEDKSGTYTCRDTSAAKLYDQYQRSITEIRARSLGIIEPSTQDISNLFNVSPLNQRGAPKNAR